MYGTTTVLYKLLFMTKLMLSDVNRQCCITVEGEVILRSEDTINPKIATGKVEAKTETLTVLGKSAPSLPFEVDSSTETKEDVRLNIVFGFKKSKSTQ